MSIDKNILQATGKVIRRKSKKSMVAGILLILLSGLLYGVSTTISDHNSSLYMLCFLSGIVFLTLGLLKLFILGKEEVYAPTGSPLRSYSVYFDSLAGDLLYDLIREGRFEEVRTARRKETGPVRLDVERSADNRFVALQVLQFIPYNYEKIGEVHTFEEDQAVHVAACVGDAVK